MKYEAPRLQSGLGGLKKADAIAEECALSWGRLSLAYKGNVLRKEMAE